MNDVAIGPDGMLYVVGQFSGIGGETRDSLASVNPTTGEVGALSVTFGPYTASYANRVRFSHGNLYMSGNFTSVNSTTRNRLASVTTSGTLTSWNPDADGVVDALDEMNGVLYVGGQFTYLGVYPRGYAGAIPYNSSTPTSWDPNANGIVSFIHATPTTIFLGGAFSAIGGYSRTGIAAVNVVNSGLQAFSPAITSSGSLSITSIKYVQPNVYIGGVFDTVGGASRSNMACVSIYTSQPTSWVADASDYVDGIQVLDGKVIMGGGFYTVNSINSRGLAAVIK